MIRSAEEEAALALSDVCSGAQALRPPKRVSVSQGAAENLVIGRPGGTTGKWDPTETPYMVEPIDLLGSRHYDAVVFVGPSQSGKSVGLGEGWLAHAVVNDPGDMLMVQMSREKAREYSKQRIDRALEHSPNLKAMLAHSPHDDNTHDKKFRHGMFLRIGWPTVSNMASSSYRYVFITDLDRMDDNIGGEGDIFGLAAARTRTFLSRGMVCVESSPGREVVDPHWRQGTRHEAPPVTGSLGIYNRSDRRRRYWKCPHCGDWFEAAPGLGMFGLPLNDSLVDSIRQLDIEELVDQYNRIICPNGCVITAIHKKQMDSNGLWLRDGLSVTANNELVGTPRMSRIAGFWLGGVAVAYQTWAGLLRKHFQALLDYSMTGSEESLKTTLNTDQGMPYMSQLLSVASRQLAQPESRKERALERFIVPDEARYIVAAVDIQGGQRSRFVVQVHAIGPHFEEWLIDRYAITLSKRVGMGEEFAPIDPASYPEDWDILTERVVRSTYRTTIAHKELRVRMTVVDSGGEDGVTDKAYAWYRRIRRDQMAGRVMLIKGAPAKGAPPIKESMLGARSPKEKGDIPVYLLNSNVLKDSVSNGLRRQIVGPGYYHFPSWLSPAFFDELSAEVRQPNGTWAQVRKNNEAFDLCAYLRAGALKLGADKIRDWGNAPPWARPLAENSELITSEDRREMKDVPIPKIIQAPVQTFRGRRMARSSYLG